jgi:hypothetical protein
VLKLLGKALAMSMPALLVFKLLGKALAMSMLAPSPPRASLPRGQDLPPQPATAPPSTGAERPLRSFAAQFCRARGDHQRGSMPANQAL